MQRRAFAAPAFRPVRLNFHHLVGVLERFRVVFQRGVSTRSVRVEHMI